MRTLLLILLLIASTVAISHTEGHKKNAVALSDETIAVLAGETINIPVLDKSLLRQYNPKRLTVKITAVPSHGNVLVDAGAHHLIYHHAGQSTVEDRFTFQLFYHDKPVSNEVTVTLEISES